jgi:hypothetical protein
MGLSRDAGEVNQMGLRDPKMSLRPAYPVFSSLWLQMYIPRQGESPQRHSSQ